jgi:hypothetical protein
MQHLEGLKIENLTSLSGYPDTCVQLRNCGLYPRWRLDLLSDQTQPQFADAITIPQRSRPSAATVYLHCCTWVSPCRDLHVHVPGLGSDRVNLSPIPSGTLEPIRKLLKLRVDLGMDFGVLALLAGDRPSLIFPTTIFPQLQLELYVHVHAQDSCCSMVVVARYSE